MKLDEPVKILVVDDTVIITKLMVDQLSRKYGDTISCHEADSAARALEIIQKEGAMDIVISDLQMPDVSGIDFLRDLKEKYPDMLRILLSGYADLENLANALNDCAVCGFISKPWKLSQLYIIIDSAVSKVMLRRENILLNEANRKSFDEILHILGDILEELSPELAEHSRFTAALCVKTGRIMKLPEDAIHRLETAGHLHCLGLLGMPKESFKVHPTQLAGEIRGVYMNYPEISAEMLKATPRLEHEREIIRIHHENVDGTGPAGMSGDHIRVEAKILRICEYYSAAIKLRDEDRQITASQMTRKAGAWFDKKCLQAFLRALKTEITSLMIPLPVSELIPGMKVAEDVYAKSGRMVLASGTVITTLNLKRLAIYSQLDKIEEVFILVEQ